MTASDEAVKESPVPVRAIAAATRPIIETLNVWRMGQSVDVGYEKSSDVVVES